KGGQRLEIGIQHIHLFSIAGTVVHRLRVGICCQKIKSSSGAANSHLKGVIVRVTDRFEPRIAAEIGSTVSLAHQRRPRSIVSLSRNRIDVVFTERTASQGNKLQTESWITGVCLQR